MRNSPGTCVNILMRCGESFAVSKHSGSSLKQHRKNGTFQRFASVVNFRVNCWLELLAKKLIGRCLILFQKKLLLSFFEVNNNDVIFYLILCEEQPLNAIHHKLQYYFFKITVSSVNNNNNNNKNNRFKANFPLRLRGYLNGTFQPVPSLDKGGGLVSGRASGHKNKCLNIPMMSTTVSSIICK